MNPPVASAWAGHVRWTVLGPVAAAVTTGAAGGAGVLSVPATLTAEVLAERLPATSTARTK